MAEEGIRLAIDEYNERHFDAVTLIVRDDADQQDRAGDLVRELERLGAVAIVGPLRSEALEVVTRRRRDRDLVIISPTAPENLSFERNTFSLFSTTERVTSGARAGRVCGARPADRLLRRDVPEHPGGAEPVRRLRRRGAGAGR
jgi:ABC-type branched-subunit amino acid transport system substrate-binding protein